jgi:hypothetical protein
MGGVGEELVVICYELLERFEEEVAFLSAIRDLQSTIYYASRIKVWRFQW